MSGKRLVGLIAATGLDSKRFSLVPKTVQCFMAEREAGVFFSPQDEPTRGRESLEKDSEWKARLQLLPVPPSHLPSPGASVIK